MILSVVLVMWVCAPSFGQAPEFKKGELIVEIQPDASIEAINARYGTSIKQRLYNTNFYLLGTYKEKKEKKWRKRLRKDPEVISAELNPLVTTPSLFARSTVGFPDGFAKPGYKSNDFWGQQELFNLIEREEVNQRSTGRGVVVAVIDTGIDSTHPDLIAHLWNDTREGGDVSADLVDNDGDGLKDDFRGWDFVDKDNDPNEAWGDPQTTIAGHGTFIARIISLLAPDCRIMPVRAFGPDGIADAFVVASAIKYAADHGADVINLSLGSPETSPLLQAAIQDAHNRGVFLVAAVGNDNNGKVHQYPSSDDNVLAVAAIDLASHKASFSNFGNHVDVCAPGANLISAFPAENSDSEPASYARWSGTSFAAPFVSAEAALILQVVDPANTDVRNIIEGSALNIDSIEGNEGLAGMLGRGRIHPLEAMKKVNAPVTDLTPDGFSQSIALIRAGNVAEGQASATIRISGSLQEFTVSASGLRVDRTIYKLAVNGVLVTTPDSVDKRVDHLGSLKFSFSNGGVNPLPLPSVTSVRLVELRDSNGAVLFRGEFKLDGSPIDSAKGAFKRAYLVSPTNPARTGGAAIARLEGSRQELSIRAEALTSGQVYTVRVDGVFLGSYTANASGFVGAFFANDGTTRELPIALRPVTNIRRIELLDSTALIVRRGEFLTVTATAAAITPR
jgi:hypothetical protein